MTTYVIAAGGWSLDVDRTGVVHALSHESDAPPVSCAARPVLLEVGGDGFVLDTPSSVEVDSVAPGSRLSFAYSLAPGAPLMVTVTYTLTTVLDGVALGVGIQLDPQEPIGHDVAVRVPAPLTLTGDRQLFAPLRNGVGFRQGSTNPPAVYEGPRTQFDWHLGGGTRSFIGGLSRPLGVPLVGESSAESGWRLTWCADPAFSTSFRLRDAADAELNWRYLGAVGLSHVERHQVFACPHRGSDDASFDAFYATAMADVPRGPAWLQDIALVHYDFLSKDGDGWFRDVDALSQLLTVEERRQACLCVHGWYDVVGRYSMDDQARAIDESWTVVIRRLATGMGSQRPSAGELQSIPMTRERVREMLAYARDRHFRVALYYGDGVVADGTWAAQTMPTDAVLRAGGWEGSQGPAVLLNPLHDAVRSWFLDYTRALIDAFGDLVDALVWDETYYIAAGELGPGVCPGYVDRSFLELVKDVSAIAHQANPDLALLGSDNVGVAHAYDGVGAASVPYSLVADGCWQDSACVPDAWPYGLFPNRRNVLWSCNWRAVSHMGLSEYGVREFLAPVPTSNGFHDDRGPAEMDDDERRWLLDLFRWRAARRGPPPWLEEGDPRTPGFLRRNPVPLATSRKE